MRDADCEAGVTWPQAFRDVGMAFAELGGAWLLYKFVIKFFTGED